MQDIMANDPHAPVGAQVTTRRGVDLTNGDAAPLVGRIQGQFEGIATIDAKPTRPPHGAPHMSRMIQGAMPRHPMAAASHDWTSSCSWSPA